MTRSSDAYAEDAEYVGTWLSIAIGLVVGTLVGLAVIL